MRLKVYIAAFSLLAVQAISAKTDNLTAYIGYASFATPSGQTYIENYITVIGTTINYVKQNNKYQGKVQVSVSYSQGDSVKKLNIYNILSPEISDTFKEVDFIDVQRYWLPKGVYMLEIKLEDLNDTAHKVISVKGKINIGYSKDTLCVSDAEFLQSSAPVKQTSLLSKSGYDMVPYVYNYYPASLKQMSFYAEIYNAAKLLGSGQKFVVKYYLETSDTHTPLNDFTNISVQPADTVNPILGGFNIEKLPAGNYNLVVSAVDKTNHVLVARRYNFIRSSPHADLSIRDLAAVNVTGTFADKLNNKDTLLDYVKSLWPIASLNERNFITSDELKNTNLIILKQYFYNFWVSRNPGNPQEEWRKYNDQVKAVNKSFGTFSTRGYQTDRGRVYLQYGSPNQRTRSDLNPSAYPYEIWEYYKLPDGEVDTKFVFYEPALSTNNYVLLHSDAKGEIQNRQWQLILYSRTGQPNNIDQNTITDPYGDHALDDFSTPH